MNLNKISELVAQTEAQLFDLNEMVGKLKSEISLLTEENNQLRMTNHDLHELLLEHTQEVENQEKHSTESNSKKTTPHLQNYYDEGIHVCHQLFGARRDESEECIFCLAVLDKIKSN